VNTINQTDEFFNSLQLNSSGSKEENDPTKLALQDFLDLMVSEMTNQDPTKPMDNAQISAQIAQFGAVSGIGELNTSFNKLASSLTSDQTLQAANLVGREVLVPGFQGHLASGGALEGVIPLEQPATDVTVRITDRSGSLVKELPLGAHPAGDLHFKWDGMADIGEYAPSGDYFVEVQAKVDGKPVAPMPMFRSRVESISIGGEGKGIQLNLLGAGPVALNEVKEIH